MTQHRRVLSGSRGARLLPLLMASMAVTWPLCAAAQGTSASARAQALSREGRALRDGGRLTDACVRFAEARQLAPAFDVSFDLGDCYERLGKTTSAWSEYASAEKLARDAGDGGHADAARARMKALELRLSRMTIEVGAATRAEAPEILLDGQVVPQVAYGSPLNVDAGDHTLMVAPKTGPRRTLAVHVEPNASPTTVHAEDAKAAAAAPKADPPVVAAKPEPAAAPGLPADALFAEGKKLRDAGHLAQACASFAQSEALAPGVGISLYLADCYQRSGRIASAWIEFTLAANAAHVHADARESTARARAAALEPRVKRVTIAVPASTPQDMALVQIDGRTVPPALWNVAMATDAGDHLVTFQAPGVERRTYPISVAEEPSVVVHVGEAEAAAAAAGAVTTPAAATPVGEAPAPAASSAPDPGSSHDASTGSKRRQWIEVGLLGGALAAAGVGAGLLVVKNDSMSNGGAEGGRPYVDPVATAASKVAFGLGGALAASAVVLYLTNPRAKDSGLYVRPATLAGGAGASLGGAF